MAQSAYVTMGGPKCVTSKAITEDHTDTTVVAAELPAGAWVPPYGVTVYVAEAFAGGTPKLNVGDDTTADGFVDEDDITEATPGCYSGTAANAAYSDTGRYYSSADTVDVTVSAGLTGGTAYVFVQYYDFSDRDLAAN